MGVGAQRHTESACESEIGEFEVTGAIDEEILRFEVAVKDAMGVAVADALQELVCEFLDLGTSQFR